MTLTGTAPHDPGRPQTEMGQTGGEIAPYGAQQQRRPPSPGQRPEAAQQGFIDARRYLGVNGPQPLEESRRHLSPAASVGATHHDQSLGAEPHLPGSRRVEPPPHIDGGDQSRAMGQHGQAETSQSGAGRPDQAEDPPRLGTEIRRPR